MKKTIGTFYNKIKPAKGYYYWYFYHKKRIGLLLRARLENKVFTCQALQGNSNYNICINCDLTVSCNCQDFDGSGRIGTLRKQSLKQIFDGSIAKSFRKALSQRDFPVHLCPICPELSLTSQIDASSILSGYKVPSRGIMVENTVLCNMRCELCRTHRENLVKIRKNIMLSIDDVEILAEIIKEHKIERVYFFNLGEPFLPSNIYQQIKIIRDANPGIQIITSTNGVLLDSDEKIEAALLMDYIYFSIDGVDQEMINKYQDGGNFSKSYKNMARLVQLRNQRGLDCPIVEWKYVLFRGNDAPAHAEKAQELARAADIDLLGFYPGAAPLHKRSLRYTRHPYFKRLGEKIGAGIILNYKGIPQQKLAP